MLPIIKFYFFYSNEESVKELPHLSYSKNTKHPNYLKVACKLLTQTIFFFFPVYLMDAVKDAGTIRIWLIVLVIKLL